MLKVKCVLLIFCSLSLLHPMSCNKAEDNAVQTLEFLQGRIGFCPKYFQYMLSDVFIIGQLTLPNLKMGDTVRMEFYQNVLKHKMHFNGSLLPEDSSQEVINKLRNGQPISYRIDFPIGTNVPELRYVFINDKEFCATILNNVGEKIVLTHTLEIINNSLPVFNYNINIPHFAEEPSCSADDMEVASNGVYGGAELRCGEYPWLTAIYKKQGNSKTFICSGLLVTSRIVLTAANCFQGLTTEEIVVYLGRYNTTSLAENDIVVRETESVIKHPEYKPGLYSSDADIALLKMKEPVSFTKFIKSICLWSEPVDAPLTSDHSELVITEENNNIGSNNATEIECQRSSPVYAVVTSPRILCAGDKGIPEPCKNNSSDELMLNRNPRWMLRGITFQQRCNSQEHTLYCDIPKHMPWLGNHIEQEVQLITGSIENVCGKSDMISRRQQPWLAAVYRKMSTGVLFFCTGSLISSSTVLAPANCFDLTGGETVNADLLRIYLGRYDLNSINENGVVSRDVVILVIHPKYKNTGGLFYDADIALLQMDRPVGFTQYVKPICLWTEANDRKEIVGETATLSSWNKIAIMDNTLSISQSMDVDIVSLRQCQITGYNVNTTSPFLCTPRFGNNLDGILMLKRNERFLLRGLSSTNFFLWKKYNSTRFRLYTDISEYVPFIQSNMKLLERWSNESLTQNVL